MINEAIAIIITFFGGPYDGLELPRSQVERLTTPITIHPKSGPRTFLVLPGIADESTSKVNLWRVEDRHQEHCYELVTTPDRIEGRYDRACTLHLAAIKGAEAFRDRLLLPPTSETDEQSPNGLILD